MCRSCRSTSPHYDRGFSLVAYQDAVKAIFRQIKFRNKPWLLNIFITHLQRLANSGRLGHYDVVVPIPGDPKRDRKREFNQAFVIAHMLKRLRHTERIVVKNVLVKKRSTLPQSGLGRRDRLKNLSGAFATKARVTLRGKKVLLVDDIVTTGSTMNECAKLLKSQGARQVDFLTLARAGLPRR